MTWEEIGTLLGMLLAVGLVLVLAYVCTRLLAGRGSLLSRSGSRSGNLRVLERLALGREQSAILVQVGTRCVLLGVTPSHITLLRELSEEEAALWDGPQLSSEEGTPGTGIRFQDALREVLKQKKP